MDTLLGTLIFLAPLVFVIWYKVKQQNWQFALTIAAYLLLVISYFWYVDIVTNQVTKLENVISDYMECWDKSETWDDTATCYLLLDSDVTLYVREYK